MTAVVYSTPVNQQAPDKCSDKIWDVAAIPGTDSCKLVEKQTGYKYTVCRTRVRKAQVYLAYGSMVSTLLPESCVCTRKC